MENSSKDPHLWEIAQRRVAFKKHLASYIVINTFLWGLWYFSGWRYDYTGFPWPIWSSLGWGIGLLFHFLNAYVFHQTNSVEKEYDKLVQQNRNQ
jgi:hypothetical protein